MKKFLYSILLIALCLSIGWLGSAFQADAMDDWYPGLIKSRFTPPGEVFPIVWTLLYILMGISFSIILQAKERDRQPAIGMFFLQLILNFLWTIFFFTLRQPFTAFVELIVLDIVVVCYTIMAYGIRKVAAYLFIPYLVWLALATYLNAFIAIHN